MAARRCPLGSFRGGERAAGVTGVAVGETVQEGDSYDHWTRFAVKHRASPSFPMDGSVLGKAGWPKKSAPG